MSDNAPLLRLCGLWLRTSVKGNEYFAGRIGGARVLIMANRDAGKEGEPSHVMYLSQAPDRPAETARNPATQRNPDP